MTQTPKEKAEELVEKMYFSRVYLDGENYIPTQAWIHAKQCAIIAVENEINDLDKIVGETWKDDKGRTRSFTYEAKCRLLSKIDELKLIKSEIEKL